MKLELQSITKRFGTTLANDQIDLTVEPGEVHALLGENGAGKSTLMNVLFGLCPADEGRILVDGHPVAFGRPSDAMRAGIGMVHQHFMLVPVFTVTENVILGHEATAIAGFLRRRQARRDVARIADRYGLALRPDAIVGELSIGIQQRVEILKALSRHAELLVLDEPTAVLTPSEADDLIDVIRALAAGGTSVVFISHKLNEVRRVADRITVIRRGRVAGRADPTASADELAALMVGRPVQLVVHKCPAAPGPVVLDVCDLTVVDTNDVTTVDRVTLRVRAGEIYALAGVQGNGQTELVETIMGRLSATDGHVEMDGARTTARDTGTMLAHGVGYVPEDRVAEGLVPSFSIADNLILDLHRRAPFVRWGRLSAANVMANARKLIKEFDIRPDEPTTPAATLSGGNQQKVVLARALSRALRLLIVCQPTRGVDVGSMEMVHRRIIQARDAGGAVLLVSTELDEVLGLADRIGVMYGGRIVGELPGGASADQVGLLMAGHAPTPATQNAEEITC